MCTIAGRAKSVHQFRKNYFLNNGSREVLPATSIHIYIYILYVHWKRLRTYTRPNRFNETRKKNNSSKLSNVRVKGIFNGTFAGIKKVYVVLERFWTKCCSSTTANNVLVRNRSTD